MTAARGPAPRTLVLGGEVADGRGGPLRSADLLIAGDRVERVERPGIVRPEPGDLVIDASGKVVAPGFIDVHSHDDNAPLLADETAKILQGVTTEVVGNCGASLAPLGEDARRDEQVARLRRLVPLEDAPWHSFGQLLGRCDERGYVTNYAPLVGHGTIRMSVMGLEARRPSATELAGMVRALDEALDAGAFGLSSGLMYAPGVFADVDELCELAGRLGPHRVYATHLRNESDHVLASLGEALEVARRTRCRLQVSHLKSAGQPNYGKVGEMLAAMERARGEGAQVSHDVYPYEAASTELASCLPPWAHEGSSTELLERLADPAQRDKMRRDVEAAASDWDNAVASCGYEAIVVASTASGEFEGESLTAIAERLGIEPFDAMAHVLSSERLEVAVIEFCMSEDDVTTALRAPHAMVGSDGLPPGTGGRPHPRRFGTFPRILRRFVRETGALELAEAVRKMTSLPAETFGLTDRGVICSGAIADVVVFDPVSVGDRGTYDDPARSPVGIDHVLVGGHPAVLDGKWQHVRHGKRLAPPTS